MNKFIDILIDCENLLRRVGEKYWADKLLLVISRIQYCDLTHICNEILLWYGGMGSFNDLFITRLNGHDIQEFDEDIVNTELQAYRTKIYEFAKNIQNNKN